MQEKPAGRSLQIGICGTFDVQNYGDLLFPLLAEAELSRRLGPIDLHRFSYSHKTPPDWPYSVTSVADLPKRAGELDGMIIGGGHLIRFDKNVAPDYFPPTSDLHHPTGYWLTPALICLHRGCRVAWNAPGGGVIPSWAESLMHIAVGLSSYVAVRDEATRAELAPFAGGQEIFTVPDTAFGIARLADPERPSADLTALRSSLGLTQPYIVVQAGRDLEPFIRFVAEHRRRFASYQFVAVPVGPALGDDTALLGDDLPSLVKLPFYPAPLLMAELIGGAAATVGISLHLAITAIAFGVPSFRPDRLSTGKFALLSQFASVHSFAAEGEIDPAWFEARLQRRGIGNDLAAVLLAVDRHWDRMAACFSDDRSAPVREAKALQMLPALAEVRANREQAERERKDAEAAASLEQLTGEIAARDKEIEARGRQLGEKEAVIDRMRAQITERNAKVRVMRASTSWKITAPIRWIGRTKRRGILGMDRIAQTPMEVEPFEWAFANGLFVRGAGQALSRTYPSDNYKTVKGYDSEKGYEYESRALIHLGAGEVSFADGLSDAWRALAEDILSLDYRGAMSRLTGRDLMMAPMEAYVCHYGPGAWLGPHLDLQEKIVTHVLYFNADWNSADGGCLRLLRSREMSDHFAEIAPVVGNSSVLVRSDKSWHAVARVRDGCQISRRSMNVIFYRDGAVSTMFPPGDNAPLHRFPIAS